MKLGRKPKLSEHQRQEAKRHIEIGESARSILHHATIIAAT
jgi:hypothetical protein